MPADPRLELIYQEAIRGLTEQQNSLDELRGRAGHLVAAITISTTFLGGLAVREGASPGSWEWVAIILFIAAASFCAAVLWPARDAWHFRFDAKELLKNYVDDSHDIDTVLRDLAIHAEDNHRNNGKKLTRLYDLFQTAVIFLILEVVVWVGAIVGGAN